MVNEYIDGITVVIPSIPPRADRLQQAIESVHKQTIPVHDIIITLDTEKVGAAQNRDAGLFQVKTKWTAFLDDDDFFYPTHLEDLLKFAEETDADLVFPWFDVIGGMDPFPQFEGLPWDNDNVRQVPITHMVKTEAAMAVKGFSAGWDDDDAADEAGNRMGEDLHFIFKLVLAGYKIEHLNKRTWGWNHWGYGTPDSPGNTSGLASRW